jgi:hypothetical protein
MRTRKKRRFLKLKKQNKKHNTHDYFIFKTRSTAKLSQTIVFTKLHTFCIYRVFLIKHLNIFHIHTPHTDLRSEHTHIYDMILLLII